MLAARVEPCSFEITFAAPGDRRDAGEPVSGLVRVRAHRDLPARTLAITAVWSAFGRGTDDLGIVMREDRANCDWRRGSVYEYPFSFSPDGPPSYSGKQLTIAWRVEARASLGEWVDATASAYFSLPPPPASALPPGPLRLAEGLLERRRRDPAERFVGWASLPFGFAMSIAAYWLFSGTMAWVAHWNAIAGGLCGAATLVLLNRNRWVERRLGQVEVFIASPVHRGGTLPAEVRVHARKEEPASVAVSLRCHEQILVMGPEDDGWHAELVYERTATSSGSGGERSGVFRCVFEIPPDAPASFQSTGTAISWTLTVRIPRRGRDWSERFKVRVLS